ncbi:MAG: CAP domain-containing protein [Devosia sp.]
MMLTTTLARFAIAAILAISLAACSSTRLSDGLTQRMDSGTAQLNSGEAIGIINSYRSTVGVGALMEDPALSAQAKTIAANYAKTGRQATKPEGTSEIRYSAGYSTFAETFSGWRNSDQKSLVMSGTSVTRAGIAVVYEENSPYGVYWVVIVA